MYRSKFGPSSWFWCCLCVFIETILIVKLAKPEVLTSSDCTCEWIFLQIEKKKSQKNVKSNSPPPKKMGLKIPQMIKGMSVALRNKFHLRN